MSLIRLIYILSPLMALFVGIYSYRYLDKKLKVLLLYAIVGFCTELIVWITLKMGVKYNTPALHFYIMFEFLIWAVFYTSCLKGFINRKYILIVAIIFIVYCIINTLFIQELKSYPNTRMIEDLLIIFFAILLYTKIMIEAKIENLIRSPLMWINTAVLLYFAGNFFYNIVFVYMLVVDQAFLRTTALYIFGLFNFLYYSGIAAGFLLHRKSIPATA